MNQIIVTSVHVDEHRLEVNFKTTGEVGRYFNADNHSFWAEYSIPITEVPQSVAVIPFVCNVLPIAWLTNATIELPELDAAFFKSIDEFKKGYIEMYPMLKFKGKINAKSLTNSILPPPIPNGQHSRTAAFFSGGVDAFATLIAHADEHPALITLWGSDITHEDTKGWDIVKKHTLDTANIFGVEPIFVKTNFRTFIDYTSLNRMVNPSGDSWWHGFQHGIGLIGHGAPIAHQFGLKDLYIASTFTIKEKGKVTCASDPSIDNHVRFLGTTVHHDQYEYTRQEKVAHIVEYAKQTRRHIDLRVCWITAGGENCCRCEKCLRTMFEIFAEGADPHDFGFKFAKRELYKSKWRILVHFNSIILPLWQDIQDRMKETDAALLPKEILWARDYDFQSVGHNNFIKLYRFAKRCSNKIARILRIR